MEKTQPLRACPVLDTGLPYEGKEGQKRGKGNLPPFFLDFRRGAGGGRVFVIATPSRARGKQSHVLRMNRQYYVYILTNKNNTVLYTGVTNNLAKRVYEHREKLADGFTKKYNVNKLVYYEVFDNAYLAISREKQIKGGSRQKKIDLINGVNKEWKDLYDEL